ncbi:hypothetical protein [Vibrio sinaloensis]|uniref:Uncharacterized protein n=1 Tax=Photobacterium sp. (strain ATCC 43367) TaxID=379097 RepID=A0A0A5I215_PHOS4|nr:hypothetical protein [Vibrio sinaloensis]KGY10540.1 hypothetical protein NM06_01650 [Vibrio sinaloensis]
MDDVVEKLRATREKSELLRLKQEVLNKLAELQKKEEEIDLAYDDLDDESENFSKRIEHMSQSYASFYNTTLEKDKSILTLSVAGLGFLVTFINFGGGPSYWLLALLALATMSYMICITSVITIFGMNAKYIIALTTGKVEEYKQIEVKLKKLDKRAISSFYCGLLLSLLIGLGTPLISVLDKPSLTQSVECIKLTS